MWHHLVPAGSQDPEVLRQKELRKARNKRHRDRPGLADVHGASSSWPTKVSRMAGSVGASRRISHRTPCLSPKSQAKWCWQSRPARQGLRGRPSCKPAWLRRDYAYATCPSALARKRQREDRRASRKPGRRRLKKAIGPVDPVDPVMDPAVQPEGEEPSRGSPSCAEEAADDLAGLF